jgi:hypothetical protein
MKAAETLPMLGAYFQARECYSSDLDDYIVEHALCVKDIGPWKAGDVLDVLCMDYTQGKLTEYDDQGDEIASVNLKLEVA